MTVFVYIRDNKKSHTNRADPRGGGGAHAG